MKRGRLGRDQTLQLPTFEGRQHFVTYDRSSVHKPLQAPSSSSLPTPATVPASKNTAQTTRQLPSRIHAHQRARRRTSAEQVFADLPPLEQEEEDDEDLEDERTLSRYQKESNNWLLFSGVFALITTLSITNFTIMPHHAASRQASQEILAHLHLLSEQMTETPYQAPNSLPAILRSYNLSRFSQPPQPTLVTEIRDEWVPALWYSSLIFTLMGTMLTLTIKQWLMKCTFSTFPSFFDPDTPESLEDTERLRLRRPSAQRKAEMRKTRKDTLSRIEKMKKALPFLMYSAVGMFVCGVMAKLGSLVCLVYLEGVECFMGNT